MPDDPFDPYAPHRVNTRYETVGWFRRYCVYVLLGGAAVAWAASNVPDLLTGNNAPYATRQFVAALCLAVPLFGIAAVLNRRRLKWVQTSEKGIQWYARGRVWHRDWGQLVDVRPHSSIYYKQPDGTMGLCFQITTVTFDDGTRLEVKSWECATFWYLGFRDFVQRQRDQVRAAGRGIDLNADWCKAGRGAAEEATRFGPLFISGTGVEWDGMSYPWEQIEGYEVQQGFLIIRSVDGDEFLRRTADLGDWHTAIELLDAAAGQMAGRRGKPDRARTR